MKQYRTKTYTGYTPEEVRKAVKQEDSTLEIVVSTMNVIDSDKEMITPGAFLKTLQERGPEAKMPRIKHLWQHKVWEPIGIPLEMSESEVSINGEKMLGLKVKTRFDSSNFSQDKMVQHVDGVITEFSIGFEVMNWEKAETEVDGSPVEFTKLTEIKLWEYSSVTWGANKWTGYEKAVGEKRDQIIDQLNDRFNVLIKAMKSSRYNDQDKDLFELELKQIRQVMDSLLQEPGGPTPTPQSKGEPKVKSLEEQISIINNFRKELGL